MRSARLVLVLSILGALSLQNVALAGPVGDHGNREPEPLSPQTQRILREKDRLAGEYVRVLAGQADRLRFEMRLEAFRMSVGESARPSDFAPRTRPNGITTQSHTSGIILSTVQAPQSNNAYCGPGSGYTLLNFLGNTTSAYNASHGLSQSNLARTEYFRTDYYGNTPWYTYPSDPNGSWPVQAGLNRWRVNSITGWYVPIAYPTDAAVYKDRLVLDVHAGYPLMGNTVELANGTRFNGHPAGASQIQHWIVLDGYLSYGDTTWYTDPAANSTLNWTNAYMYNSMSSSTMLGTYLTHRGYVW